VWPPGRPTERTRQWTGSWSWSRSLSPTSTAPNASIPEQVGFNADHDHKISDELRFVQLTPPGSACSIALGTGVTDAQPGSVTGLQIVVDDIDAAHAHLATRGVEVSEVQDFPWGRFVFFKDPDGNSWAVQQIVVPDPG
jgi:catechol 2,3-dioxygenase-like lactoylglutathione lyase family enzyme